MQLYPWTLWLHIFFATLFFFVHGTAMAIAFRLPVEKDPKTLHALLNISGITFMPMGVSMLGLLVTSLYMGFAAGWIKQGWWWISFVLMLGFIVWMTWHSRAIYSPIRKALGLPYMTGFGTENPAEEPASMQEVERLIAKSNPRLLAWAGIIVTAVVLWFMTFKPF